MASLLRRNLLGKPLGGPSLPSQAGIQVMSPATFAPGFSAAKSRLPRSGIGPACPSCPSCSVSERRQGPGWQPPGQRRDRHPPPGRVQHDHRTRVDEPVHRERDEPCRPAHLPVRPHQGVGMLIRHHRRDHGHAEHRPGGRPPDHPVRRRHRAPPSGTNSAVSRHWLFVHSGFRHAFEKIRLKCHRDLNRRKVAPLPVSFGVGRTGAWPARSTALSPRRTSVSDDRRELAAGSAPRCSRCLVRCRRSLQRALG